MTDTTETPTGAPTDDTRAHNKKLIFDALAEIGIHTVTVEIRRQRRFRPDRGYRSLGRRQ